jgi:L-threonylcarbamoyladenylate synthase
MKELIKLIKSGAIFIYPTDTIYGLGCNALNKKSVERIKKIKLRDKNKPLSIIAPSKEWIYKNTFAKKKLVNKYLPGKYTLILEKKNKKFLNHVSSTEFLGVRIPDNDFCKIIQSSNIPFVTTSVNLSRKPFAKSIEEIERRIIKKVDVIVNSGKLSGEPSTIIMPDGKELKR